MIDILRIKEDFDNYDLPVDMNISSYRIHIKNNYAYCIDNINIDYGSAGFKKYNISNKDIYSIDNGMWEEKTIKGYFNMQSGYCFDFVENLRLDRPFQIQVYRNGAVFYNRMKFDNCVFECEILMDPHITFLTSNCKWREE